MRLEPPLLLLLLPPLLPRSGSGAHPPSFSWDTVPLYWYSTSPRAPFDAETARYAASFPVVVVNGNHMRYCAPSGTGEEDKLAAAAKQLLGLNRSVAVLYYQNSLMDWSQFSLHRWLKKNHPEWWVVNERGETVCLDGQPLFNHSLPEMRAHWLGTVRRALQTGLFAGAFADRANPLPRSSQPQPGPGQSAANGVLNASGDCVSPPDGLLLPPFQFTEAAYGAWADGHAQLLRDAQKAAGDAVVVANNNATVGVGGRQFERWCRADFDKATIDEDIQALQQAGAAGTLALVHGGEPCDGAALALSLSAFLVGAGSRAYFACTDGWQVAQGWSRKQRPAEYDRPLGPPLGAATRTVHSGTVRYERRFESGTRVTLELEEGAVGAGVGCIFWAGGQLTGSGCPEVA